MRTFRTISIGLISLLLSAASMPAAEPPATAGPKTEWQNITAEFVKATGLDQRKVEGKDDKGNPRLGAVYMTRFQGMLVLPNGDVLVTNNEKGMWHSTDQGATWAKYGEPWMKGVCQNALSMKMYYPDRIGLTLDGPVAVSSDLGKSWVKVKRPNVMITKRDSTQVQSDVTIFAADMDLSVNTPVKTILGFLHHGEMVGGMFVHTSDGGATWDWSGPLLKDTRRWMRTGVADATTLLRGEEPAKGDMLQPGILRSTDFGQTWTKVAAYTLHGTCPVHYGSNIYWAAREGVVVSRDSGKTWSVCGSPVANIVFGPYFGKSEQEMMVVSFKDGYSITRNGGRSWTLVARFFAAPDAWGEPGNERTCPPNQGRHWRGALWYFGWDSERNILYASPFGGNAWKLVLGSTPAAGSGKDGAK